jgi:hypothetical protein
VKTRIMATAGHEQKLKTNGATSFKILIPGILLISVWNEQRHREEYTEIKYIKWVHLKKI